MMVGSQLTQGVPNRGVETAVKKSTAGDGLLFSISGLQGTLLLDGQQVYLTMAGDVETMAVFTPVNTVFFRKDPAA